MKIIKKELNVLRYWVSEREEIRKRRERGVEPPWTDDKILQEHRFCNVSRRFDKMTRVLAKDLESDSDLLGRITRISAYRAFNRLSSWDLLRPCLGHGWWRSADARKALRSAHERGEKLLSGVWMVAGVKGEPAWVSQLRVPTVARKKCPRSIASLHNAFYFFESLPMIGPFVANEMVMDLAYLTEELDSADDRETYVRLGPGAVRGLRRLQGIDPGPGIGQPRANDDDWAAFARVKDDLVDYSPIREMLTIHDVEHVLCEYDKYQRAKEGGHIKNRFKIPA